MFLNDPVHHWKCDHRDDTKFYYKGDKNLADQIAASNYSDQTVESLLKKNNRFASGVVENNNFIIAYTDHIRSWPIFFSCDEAGLVLSNNARLVRDETSLTAIDEISCLEFTMSGYVTGDKTLYSDLKCLQPGEFLTWNKGAKSLSIKRYHRYIPNLADTSQTADDNMTRIGEILDQSTKNIIARAEGRPIWIPLSGGLDSRILLCKLLEHGYKNIQTFTYGPRFNFEAKIARKVAKTLNVPWMYVCPSKADIRRYFESVERKQFWNSTDGLKAIASMREFSALMWLREYKLIPDDVIILNGQSGDYITGGHLSDIWTKNKEFKDADFIETIINKHYSLWSNLKTSRNIEVLESRIKDLAALFIDENGGLEYAKAEEMWEFDARQVCLVANGQRSYDFFGYDWEMPLWDKELVDFCEQLPFDQKIGQSLYKKYLQNYNYKELFPAKEPYIWRWPLLMMWVVPVAQIVGLVKGRGAKDKFYALMRYHGHYANQFAIFSWRDHKKVHDIARNVIAMNLRHWLKENSEIIPDTILDAVKVDKS